MTTEKSTHKVEVIRIGELLKHENADNLSKIKIYDYNCCVRTSNWKEGDLAAFIPPDSNVDVTRPEFTFLAKKAKDGKVRIRTEKLRGIVSYGLLVPAPVGSNVGDDVASILGIEHWEPNIDKHTLLTGGEAAKSPTGVYPVYDVDSFLRHGREIFVENEPVFVTEKIHGCSSKYVFKDEEIHCGSRNEFKKEYPSNPNITLEQLVLQFNNDEKKAKDAFRKIENWKPPRNLWWIALDNAPAIKKFCQKNPGYSVYGEVYGQVGSGWNYGVANGKYSIVVFDILTPDSTWMNFPEFLATCKKHEIPHVPVIHESIPFNFNEIVKMAEGNSFMNGFTTHIKEGVVVGTLKERWDERVGRVKLKVINPEY